MADRWYYGRAAEIFGPYSGWEVADLADAGQVLPTDTVWEDGADAGVQAATILHLFPTATAVVAAPAPVAAAPAPVAAARAPPVQPARRGRAVGGPGVMIVGQDGTTARYRMKCTTCGQEDRNTNTLRIARGTTRVGFFCPKCRKRRTGEVQGHLS